MRSLMGRRRVNVHRTVVSDSNSDSEMLGYLFFFDCAALTPPFSLRSVVLPLFFSSSLCLPLCHCRSDRPSRKCRSLPTPKFWARMSRASTTRRVSARSADEGTTSEEGREEGGRETGQRRAKLTGRFLCLCVLCQTNFLLRVRTPSPCPG